jgi:hypothetical protein
VLTVLLGTLAGLAVPTGTGAGVAEPTASGPVAGGGGVPIPPNLNRFDLAEVGYEQAEYFLSGTASAYAPNPGPLTSDGKWTVAPSTTAPYTTRLVVHRPTKPKRFNGTVLVEWLNVSGGVDANPDWTQTHVELVREGAVWVGMSAQIVGINATKNADPIRYASLSHPGDSFSYDIFSQAGEAIRNDPKLLLGGPKPKALLAAGESQSAWRMVTYINAVHPLARVYDGFLVHSRTGSAAPLAQAPQEAVLTANPTLIRDDLDVPVLVFQTETDVGSAGYRQPDTKRYRLWEVAGSAHYDHYGLAVGPSDVGDGQGAVLNLAAMQAPATDPNARFACTLPINAGGTHWVLNAAVHQLDRWVVTGTPPPVAPRLELTSTAPVTIARDEQGNALGGVRSPHVDAPIAAVTGTRNGGSRFCFLFGTTVPFTPEQLAALYPTHKQFASKWNQATRQAVNAGFLLEPDAKELRAAVAQSEIASIGK